MYNGYYCKKCKLIPIIKPNISENKVMKFMIKCRCHINYLTLEQMNKNYYFNNIDKKDIINEKIMSDIDDEYSINDINNLLNKMKHNNESLLKFKTIFLDFMNKKIIEIEKLFDKLKIIYINFEKFAKILIKSYVCINSNYSNIKNIKFNSYNKYEIIDKKDFEESLNENSIDSSIQNTKNFINQMIPIDDNFKQIKLINNQLEINQIFKILDELLLVNNLYYLAVVQIEDFKSIVKVEMVSLEKIQIDRQNNILCLYSNSIKILPKITLNQIEHFKQREKNIDKEDDYDYDYDFYNYTPSMNIKPIIEFNTNINYTDILYYYEEDDNINKDKFIVYYKNYIHFYLYKLDQKILSNFFSINLEKDEKISKIGIIKKNNKNILLIFTSVQLLLFDLTSLKILKNINMEFDYHYIITINQINNDEVLFNERRNIYILNLKKYNINLKLQFVDGVTHSFLLKDKSIVICGVKCAKRLSPKTFEIMNTFYYSHKQDGNYDYDYDFNIPPDYFFIVNTFEISDTKILLFLKNGDIELHELLF